MPLEIRVKQGTQVLLERLDLQELLALREPQDRPDSLDQQERRGRQAALERQVLRVRPA